MVGSDEPALVVGGIICSGFPTRGGVRVGWTIAVGVLAALVVAEAVALWVLWSRLQRSRPGDR